MNLDSFNARALLIELRPLLIDSRLQKFSQVSEFDFLLHFRSPGRTDKLLVSLHPEWSRFHLLPGHHPPSIVPNAFVMQGRKHLGGCRVVEMRQLQWERSLEWTFSSGYRLVFDWTGRPSALLIINDEPGVCVGAYPQRGRFPLRQPYSPREGAFEPLDPEEALRGVLEVPAASGSLKEALGQLPSGWPPLWIKRFCKSLGFADIDSLRSSRSAEFLHLWESIPAPLKSEDPTILKPGLATDGELTYLADPEATPFASMQLAASGRWAGNTEAPGLPDDRGELLKTLRKGRDKSKRKMEKREKDKRGAESAPRDKLYGDLLLAYGSSLGRRQTEFRTQDWEGRPVVIPLEPHLGATENAEKYYNRGKKKKRALAVLDEQIALAREEMAYWDDLIFAAEGATTRTDINEVRKGIPGPRQGIKKKVPAVPTSGPRRFEIDGFLILVGRNPTQNEKLSLKDAGKEDHWFHIRQGAGSHVVLRTLGREPSENAILAGAWLAGHYSRSVADPSAEVITTRARFLKKPKGGPLGKVTYRSEREIVVDATSAPPEGLRRMDKKEPQQ